MRSTKPRILLRALLALVFAFLTSTVPLFAADKEKLLHNFQGQRKDGAQPYAALIFDAAGNLYGTTSDGGDNQCGYDSGCGTVFQLTPTGDGNWTETVLHIFGSGMDGYTPFANLIFDTAGNLYGTTSGGGDSDSGTVFQLAHGANGTWAYTVLYSFAGDPDGSFPVAGLIFDAAGNLYGTTADGGPDDAGTVFELIHATNGKWIEKVLHAFSRFNGKNGFYPEAGVILDAAGNLYGTTCCGGAYGSSCSPNSQGCGTVFELIHATNGKWEEKVLHNLNHNGKDGYNPDSGLIFDSAGNLYGTAQWGGVYTTGCAIVDGCGIVFELSPRTHGGWKEKVLHSFNDNGKDGAIPAAGLIFDTAGNLYGTTMFGGAYGSDCNCGGTVFKLAPRINGTWTEKVLHSFGNGRDGEYPEAGLILDPAGNLYGTTDSGGAFGMGCGFYYSGYCGTVFEITP